MLRPPRIAPTIYALRSARKRWRGPIATIALFAIMAGGFALVRASAGTSFPWPESLSRIFGSRTARTLSPSPFFFAGTISLTTPGTYTQNFDTLANTGTSGTTPLGWEFNETGTSPDTNYTAGTGSGNTGDTYSFGSASATDRAFGNLRSGGVITTAGAVFVNNTGATITSLSISYTGEQWRIGNTAAARDDRLDFQYSTSGTSVTTGTYTDVNALDFTNPIKTAASVGALDGNAAANRTVVSSAITGLSIANGATFVIRWTDLDASGSDDGMSVDDFSLTPGFDAPSLKFQSAASGDWNSNGTWQMSTDGVNFVAATSTPTSANDTITIRSPDTVTVTAAVSVDQVTVDSGGTLALGATLTNSGTMAANGTLRIDSGGVFSGTAPTYPDGTGLLQYNTGGSYGRGAEWTPGVSTIGTPGMPSNCKISNNTAFDLPNGTTGSTFRCRTQLTIDSGSSFSMGAMTQQFTIQQILNNGTMTLSTAPGGNFKVEGIFQNNGTYTHNGRTTTLQGGSQIHGNTTFFDLVINTATGVEQYATTISIEGSFTNNGTFLPNSRTVAFTGNGNTQTITGANFFNLVINHTGAGGVTLNSATTVTNVLTLTSGIVTTTSSNLLSLTNTASGAVLGGSSSSYVNGPLARGLPASLSGTNTYAFPVGKGSFNPFEMLNTTTTGAITVTAEVFDTGGGSSGANVTSLNSNRRWSATSSGSFTSTSVRLTDSAVTLNLNSVIGKSGTLAGAYDSIGGSVSGATITSNPINSFSFFAIGATTFKYRSKQTGNWSDFNTWEVSSDGTTWIAAVSGQTPTSADDTITIQSPHVVTVTAAVSVDQVTFDSGGTLALGATLTNSGTMAANGTLRIDSGGTFSGTAPTYPDGTGLLQYNTGGSYGRGAEWTPGVSTIGTPGMPSNCKISNNTAFDLPNGTTNSTFRCRTQLTIDSGSSFSMGAMTQQFTIQQILNNGTMTLSTAPGGNFKVEGIFQNNGTYTHNGRTTTLQGGSQIHGNTTFFDLVINTATGVEQYATTISIEGSFTNNGTFLPNSRTVAFTGNGNTQTITGANFFNLVINHTGAGGVTLNSATTVTNVLTLTSGIVTTTSSNLLSLTNTASGAVSGGSASSYVNGPLERVLPASLASGSTYVYPVGKGGFNPFELVDPTTTSGGTMTLMAEEFDGATGGSAGAGLSAINSDRYWTASITNGSGNFTDTKVRLTNSSALSTSNRIGKAANPTDAFVAIGGVVSGSTILSSTFSTFSSFVIGTTSGNTISGTVFDANGVPIGGGRTIKLIQNGTVSGTTATSNGSGVYTFSGLTLASGDRIATFIDGAENGVTATLIGTPADITNFDIKASQLTVRTDNGGSPAITNTNLADSDSSKDSDIPYSVVTGTLTTTAGTSLQINFGGSYAPGGDINDGGNWINNGTFTAGSNTVTFNGTADQSIGGNNSTSFATLTVNPTNDATVSLAVNTAVGTALNIQAGVFSQGESGTNDFNLTTNTATVSANATWRNLGKGDLTLTGDVANSGTINFNANGASCPDADDILIRSSASPTQRTWAGTGTFSMTDVDVQDQKVPGAPTLPLQILVNDGTGSAPAANNTGWTFVNTCAGPYTWIGGANQSWIVPTNWSPVRTNAAAASTTDVLIIDGAVTPGPTITNVPAQVNSALHVVNPGSFTGDIVLQASGANTLEFNGATGDDLSVPAGGAVLRLSTTNALTILLSGSTSGGPQGNIGGSIVFEGGAHRLIGSNVNEINFASGSIFTTTTGFAGNPFGTGTDGSVVFAGGSSAFFGAGSDPFGGDGKSIVTFGLAPMSNQEFSAATAFSSNGRNYGNLTLTGGQSFSGSGTGDLVVSGNFILGSTSTLILSGTSGADMVVNGNFTDNNTSLSAFQSNGRTVTFSGGSATQTIFKDTIIGEIFSHITITKTGGSVRLLTGIAINGSLQFGGTAGSAVDVLELNGKGLSLATSLGAVPDANSGFKGDLNGAFLGIGVNASPLGSPIHFVSGGEFLSQFSSDRASGVSIDTDLTIGHPTTTPNGILTLTNGVVDMGTKTLALNPNAVVSRTNGYVVGNFKKTFGATGTFTFPVGTGTSANYSPLDANVQSGVGNSLTVKAVAGPQANVPGNKLQRYWTLSNAGAVTAHLTFHYLASDVVGNESLYQIFKYDGSLAHFTPDATGVNSATDHFATLNNVSSFSDWTLAEEPVEVGVTVSPASVLEDGPDNLVYTFTRTGSTASPLTVNFDVLGSTTITTEYTVSGTDVTFSTGSATGTVIIPASSTTATVTVDPTADTDIETDQTVKMNVATGSGYIIGTPASATGTFTNDDGETNVAVTGGNLTVTDNNGGTTNDTLTISLVAGPNIRINDPANTLGCGPGTTQVNANTCEAPLASVTGNIQVNTLGGNDTLTLSLAGGDFIPSGGVSYDGGNPTTGPGDKLIITGGAQGTVTYNYTNGTPGAGSVDMSNFGTVNYTGLEPLTNSGDADDIIFNLPAGPTAVTLGDDGVSNTMSRLSGATFETTDFDNPSNSLTINRGDAGDTLTVNALPDFNASLAIGSAGSEFSTITFNGAVTLASNKNLLGNASSTISLPNTTSDLATSGSGTISLTTARNIALASGSSITTVDGALTLTANQQVLPTAGNFIGIRLDDADLTTTGTGNISVSGRGGADAPSSVHLGIYVNVGSSISSTSAVAGAGTITLNGTGGAGTIGNKGFEIDGPNSAITSIVGNILIQGQGGAGTGVLNNGVDIYSGASVSSSGTATITIDGTGGNGSGNCYGVGFDALNTAGTTVSSVTGDITITGVSTATTGTHQDGIRFEDSVAAQATAITTTGSATLTMTGTAGNNDPTSQGIDLSEDATITLTGASNTFVADSMFIGSSNVAVNAGANAVTLRQKTNSRAINLGGADSATELGLTDGELDIITAGTLNIGDTNSGAITISFGIDLTDGPVIGTLNLVTSANVTETYAGTDLTVANLNITAPTGIGTTGGGALDLPATTLTTNSTGSNGDQFINGEGIVTVGANDLNAGTGVITLYGSGRFNTVTGGGDILSNVVVASGGTLGGTGSVLSTKTTTVQSGGTVSPGTSPGILNTGAVSFSSGSTFQVEINGTTAGTGYDQLNVTGTVTLGSATLNLSGSHTPSVGDTFIIVNNDSTDGVTGNFTMGTGGTDSNGGTLAEGDNITSFLGSALNARITYAGGTDSNDVVLTVTQNADLSISKADAPDPVTEGNALTYTLTVSNAGPGSATNVVATDTLPGSVTFVSATASQGSGCTGTSTITCNLGTIANAGNATVTIVVIPNTPGSITNNASVTAAENDPTTPNTDSEGTVVNAAVCTPPPAGLVAWYPGDGNPHDIQGPTFENGTLQGGATFATGKVNQAFSFDGVSAQVATSNDVLSTPPALTMDAWVKPGVQSANRRRILSIEGSYVMSVNMDGTVECIVDGEETSTFARSTKSITDGAFHHVACTSDGSTTRLYVDGVPDGTASETLLDINSSSNNIVIGNNTQFVEFYNGLIDEVEIFNQALTGADIANIYNASFAGKCRTCTTPPTEMVSWWPFDETSGTSASDIAGPNNLTVSGATFTAGKVNNALNFDGTDDDAVVGSSASLESATNAVTVDAWVFWRGHTLDPSDRIVSKRLAGGNVSYHLVIINSQLTFGVKTATLVNTVDPNPFPTNRWVHVAGTYDGSNIRLFRDGVQVSPTTPVTGTIEFDGGDLAVGWYDLTFPERMNGLIDELEIFNRALGQTEIAALANAGDAGKCHTSTVTVTVSPSSVPEDGGANLVYTFTRNGDISAALPVDFTVGGSATFGGPNADYTQTGAGSFSSSSGTVTFGAGSSTATVTIDPAVDQTDEPNEDVVLTITSGSGYTIGTPNTATGAITDDDPTPSITIDDVSVAEGSGGGNTSFVFTVSLSNPSSSAVDVTFTTADNTAKTSDTPTGDYTLSTGTLTIPANTSSGQITVLVGADTKLEPNETFFVDLTGATNGTITDGRGIGTIQNDDAGPTISINSVTMVEGDTGTTNFVFTVTKTGVTGERARVDFATANGTTNPAAGGGTCGGATDYVSQTGTVTFTPAETIKTITVAVCGEMTIEGDETFFVNLSNPVNASITTGQGLGTITNDDTDVSVAVTPSDVAEDGATNLVYTFTRNPLTPGPITVNFTVGGTAVFGTDYTQTDANTFNASSGTVIIPNSSTTATVTIDPTADTDYEFDETVVLTITTGTGYNVGSPSAATGNIVNDDDTIIVTKTADTNGTCLPNDCSLREAINLANANSDFNNIFFDVSGAGCVSGVCTIQPGGAGTATPGTPLPAITTEVVIDGYSQPGSSVTLSATSIDAVLGIEIDGSAAGTGADGLVLDTGSDFSTIMGLVINRFDGNGIKVISSQNEIIGNFIGTNAAGTAASANHVGIYINNSANNVIGCTIPSERNLISGNTDEGIEIYGVSPFNATDNFVQGNFIGTDKTGLLDVGNGGAGVKVYDGSNNTIGVDSISLLASGGNVISGNGGNGVEIAGGVSPATNNTVYGNFIGTDLAATADISNTGNGVAIYNSSLNKVGQPTTQLRNVITNNDKAGVLIEEVSPGTLAARNAIRANLIYNNGTLGIDLTNSTVAVGTGDGVTANDAGDGDGGANRLQNFPVITTADVDSTTISGTLDSESGLSFTIDVYDNNGACDGSGNGEGKTYLGSATAVEGAPGQYTWSLTPVSPLTGGQVLTATATDSVGNTSEFSTCFLVNKRVQFAQANTNDTETNTGSHAVNIAVTRTGGSGGEVDVNFNITDGSATTGDSDYSASPSSGTLHWDDGDSTPKNIVVTVNGDNKHEINEIVNLTLFSPVGAILGTPSSATLTIVNDDAPPILSVNFRSVNEGTTTPPATTPVIFTVTKFGNPTALTATVNFNTEDDTGGVSPATSGVSCGGSVDYQSQNGSLSFAPNETTKTITVQVCRDATYEANDTYVVRLTSPTNATLEDDQGLGTILNDDSPGAIVTVNTTADTDDGVCSALGMGSGNQDCTLREAINAANASGTAVTISFGIPATDSRHYYYKDDGIANHVTNDGVGNHVLVTTAVNDAALPTVGPDPVDPDWQHAWYSIATGTTLPTVVKSVVIDGYTQTDASLNTAPSGNNAILRIEINGDGAGTNVDGLTFTFGTSIIKGLVINRFHRDGGAGTPLGNGLSVSGSNYGVSGNFLGTDVSGTLDLGNGGAGVLASSGSTTVIGGSTADLVNLISGNDGDGVLLNNTNGAQVKGNLIGTKSDGTSALGNSGSGVTLTGGGSVTNQIGSSDTGEANTIANNGADGVRLATSNFGNSVRGNSIYSNGSTANDLGIDLGTDGVTANDSLDGDTGPNGLQNFPVITSAIVTGSTKTITGTLNSTADETFNIDFYANASCDTSGGNGEGQTYLGSTSVTTDGSTGDVSFTFHPTSLVVGQVVTATATTTGAQFNTSEFSACMTVTDGSGNAGDIQFTSATYTVNENVPGGNAAITLTRVGGTNGQIQTTFHTTNGSATAPGDYTDSTQTVVFNEGETSKTVNVPITDDSVYEGNETVNLSVDSPPQINAAQRDGESLFLDPHAAVLTITENDPVPSFSIASVTSNEGDSGTTNFDFVITKTGATAVNAQVSYATADQTATGGSCGTAGVDYASQSLTQLTFLPAETTKTVTIQVCGDGTVEFDETFVVNLSNPVTATISSSQGTGTITNDDCPTGFLVNHAGDTHDFTPGDGVCLDSNQNCTLRAAIEEANALIGCAATIPINFAFSTETIIVLPLGQLSVEHNVNIIGPTTYSLTIDGNGTHRAFRIDSDNTVSISNLTITDCAESAGDGGAILNTGTLTLNGVLVNGNSAVNGGGIASTTNNSLTLINTTISGNNSTGNGGGLYNVTGEAVLTNVTIAYNTADTDGVGSESGGGIFVVSGDVTLHNTIVADNLKGPSLSTTADDIGGNVNAASSYNVIGTGAGGLTNGGNNNQVGVASALLKPLQANGGPTQTHALTYKSPAVDTGDGCVLTGCSGSSPVVTIDQRGQTRTPLNDGDDNGATGLDIGAYERQETETRDVPFGFNSSVDIVDVIITFPCVLPCNSERANTGTAQPDAAVAPARIGPPTASLTAIDPAPLNSLTRPPNLVIGNSSSPPLPAFEVTTTASYTPPATLCFYLPSFTNPTFFAGLKVLHREAGPNTIYGDSDDVMNPVANPTNDFANKLVCGEVQSFSAFAIAHTATPTAANGTVSGQILDSAGKPVEGAAVRMTGTQNRLTVTDAEGNYHFDDVEINGLYVVTPSRANFSFSPAQRSFSQLGASTEATFTGAASGGALNPLDTTEYFVRQQYVDFLGREPDEAGFNFWVRNIDTCANDFGCREVKRIDTSAAFFLSIEFQQTGYLVYRTYQAAYGDMPNAPVPLTLSEFKPDNLQISNRVVVLQDGWQQRLETNKRTFMDGFVQRRRFIIAYPLTMTPTEFVDKLFANAGVPTTNSDYPSAIAEFGRATDTSDAAARARALRRVAENGILARQRFNQAFVLMEYFGYLNRDPNTGRDTDFAGYQFWLDKLNRFNGNFQDAEMVKAFLTSIEYRARFPH